MVILAYVINQVTFCENKRWKISTVDELFLFKHPSQNNPEACNQHPGHEPFGLQRPNLTVDAKPCVTHQQTVGPKNLVLPDASSAHQESAFTIVFEVHIV